MKLTRSILSVGTSSALVLAGVAGVAAPAAAAPNRAAAAALALGAASLPAAAPAAAGNPGSGAAGQGTVAAAAAPGPQPGPMHGARSARASVKDLADTTGKSAAAAARAGEQEIPGKRSRVSRTFQTQQGSFTAVISAGPLNYQDTYGAWQLIDDSLVADNAPGFAFRNAANSYSAELPADLSAGPVRVGTAGRWVAFSWQGANHSTGIVAGNTITYPNALPGVTVTYTATPTGLKEAIALASAAAPSNYAFKLVTSPGLSATSDGTGGVTFADSGGPALGFAAPTVADSAPHADATPNQAVALTLAPDVGGYTAMLAVQRSWLSAPGRIFPVIVDPQAVTLNTSLTKCHIVSGYSTFNACPQSFIDVGRFNSAPALTRGLLQFSVASIPSDQVIYDAVLSMSQINTYDTASSPTIELHANTQSWTSAATWNTRDGRTTWTTAGGAPGGINYFTALTGGNASAEWHFASLMQGWVNGSTPNTGLILKTSNESAFGVARFNSTDTSGTITSGSIPYVGVDYGSPVGNPSTATYLNQQLTGHATAGVNPATGNLLVRTTDFNVHGTGLDLAYEHDYNSLLSRDLHGPAILHSPMGGELARGWTGSLGDDVWLDGADGTSVVHSPQGNLIFTQTQINGPWTSPPGINATLLAGGTHYGPYPDETLTFHDSGLTYHFDNSLNASLGQLTSITTKNGKSINLDVAFSSNQRDTASLTDTQGRNFPFSYQGAFQNNTLQSLGDTAGGRSIGFGYDPNYVHMTSYTDPNGGVYHYGYDATSELLTTLSTPGGRTLTVGYDSSGRVASTTRSTGGVSLRTSYAYLGNDGGAPAGSVGLTQLTDPAGNITKYYFNSQREVIRTTDPLGRHRDKSFDPATGNVMSLTNNLSQVSTLAYDTNQNLTQIQAPSSGGGNSPAATVFGGYTTGVQPHPTSTTDSQHNTTTFGVDGSSNVNAVTGPGPSYAKTTVVYNTDGTAASSTDANGNVTSYGYTGGNLTSITPPAPLGKTTVGPDAVSRPHTVTDGKGQTTTNTYDRLDRITKVAYSDGSSISYTYDGDDNLTARTDRDGGQTIIGYDGLSRPTSQTFRGTAQTFGYDATSNLTSLTDPGGTVGYGYNAAGDVTSVTEPGGNCAGFSLTANPQTLPAANSGCALFHYDGAARRDQEATPGGVLQVLSYDNAGHQTEIKATQGSAVLSDLAYSYTKPGTSIDTGQRQNVTDKVAGKTTSYSHNELNRLTAATGVLTGPGTTADYNFGYDNNGNRTSSSVNGGPNPGYSYNAANELTTTGGTTAGYDGAGNLTSTSAGFAAGYDTANTTTSATNPTGGAGTPFSYADAGQTVRLTAGSTSFTQSVLGLASTAAGGTLTSYTRDPAGNLIAQRTGNTPGQTTNSYYLRDSIGTVTGLTDASGNRQASYYYDPYGQLTNSSGNAAAGNPFRFAGGYQDPTGLYHYGQRYYDPALGRWTQQDSLSHLGDLNQADRYVYAGGDPIDNIDPSGQGFCLIGTNPDGSCRGSSYFKPYPVDPIGCVSTFTTTTASVFLFVATIPVDAATAGIALPLSYLAGAVAVVGVTSTPYACRG